MNILVVNWSWYPSGGDWTYVENLCRLYERNGHKVIPFSMKDDRNFPTEYSKYFIEEIDYKELNKHRTFLNGVKVLTKSIYSNEAKRKIKWLLEENQIDLVHLNNIHHYITTSILHTLKKKKIPIIWTLHDYSILCPNTTFISNQKICESCKTHKYYYCIIKKCKKNSFIASFPAAVESTVNFVLNPYKYVDHFICPTNFIKNKFIEYGYDEKKFSVIENCYDTEILQNISSNNYTGADYILYIGNIITIKGIKTLINAISSLPIKLLIIGDGEQLYNLKKSVNDKGINNISFLGRLPKEKVLEYITKSLFLVVPSEWYEVFGYVIIEAMLLEKPIVASKIGGIPELVIDNVTGYTFKAGDVNDLQIKILKLLENPNEIMKMGKTAKKYIINRLEFESYYLKLERIYNNLNLTNN